jgi:charged multivesicular body protein 4
MAALRRKKAYEHNLEQTLNHVGTIEQQIGAIESANINLETFAAMQRAGDVMKQIHGKLTPTKVDEVMYVPCSHVALRPVRRISWTLAADDMNRDQIQEYNRLNEDIADSISNAAIGPQVDEADLEDEMEALQQQELEDKMLETGAVPVDRLPAVANGDRELTSVWATQPCISPRANGFLVKGKAPAVTEDDEEAELRKLQEAMAI